MLGVGRWLSPLNFSLRADVDLEDFAQNASRGYETFDSDDGDDVGQYPDVVEGPESPPLNPDETTMLLAKELQPTMINSPPETSDTQTSMAAQPTTNHKNEPTKRLSKAAQEKAERSRKHRRGKRRMQLMESQKQAGTSLKAVSLRRAMAAKCVAASTTSLADKRHSPSGYAGYAGSKQPGKAPVAKELSALLDDGFEYVEWDGVQGIYIVDRHDRVIVCGGSPKDSSGWQEVAVDAANAIKTARVACEFTAEDETHRRGKFPAMAQGISYGNGLQIPSNIRPNKANRRVAMDVLVKDEAIKRIAGFQSGLLDAYAPETGKYYKETLDVLTAKDTRLRKNFANSSFGAITINFGPRTVSVPHVDHANLSTGMCALTALGDFDPNQGGHLVLWDLKIVIRFPPGSTLLFPSALVKHSNLPIQANEQRYSVTQYSSGGLFRWVENGFCSDKDTTKPKGAARKAWENGIQRLQVRTPDHIDA